MVNEATDAVTRQAHEEAIVDTGATMHISGIRSDFTKIEDQPTVRMRTAGGQVKEGYNAVFKPNQLRSHTWNISSRIRSAATHVRALVE